MHSTFRSILAVAALVSTVAPAHGVGKTTVDPNTVPKPTVAAPVEIEDPRLHRISPALFADYEPGHFKPAETLTRADAAEAIFLAHRAFAMNSWR